MERYCDLCKNLGPVTDEDRWCRLSSGTWICDDCILSEAKKIRDLKIDLTAYNEAIKDLSEDEVAARWHDAVKDLKRR